MSRIKENYAQNCMLAAQDFFNSHPRLVSPIKQATKSAAHVKIFKRSLIFKYPPSMISLLYNREHKVITKGNWGRGQKVQLGGKALAYLVERSGLGSQCG